MRRQQPPKEPLSKEPLSSHFRGLPPTPRPLRGSALHSSGGRASRRVEEPKSGGKKTHRHK
eukprot:351133-Pyramimonas_sp.AAC.1